MRDRPSDGGYGLDGLWNDDFHHTAMAAMTGHNEAYYTDYLRHAAGVYFGGQVGLISTRGNGTAGRRQHRGTPSLDLQPGNFVVFFQNHDQIANSGHGQRCMSSQAGRYRA